MCICVGSLTHESELRRSDVHFYIANNFPVLGFWVLLGTYTWIVFARRDFVFSSSVMRLIGREWTVF